jgi:hypothetical protein
MDRKLSISRVDSMILVERCRTRNMQLCGQSIHHSCGGDTTYL